MRSIDGTLTLPRGDVLVIGGDLAYPNPSNETYEQRFFRPFEAAFPPPPHVTPGGFGYILHKWHYKPEPAFL